MLNLLEYEPLETRLHNYFKHDSVPNYIISVGK
jgi:hypothetical protein